MCAFPPYLLCGLTACLAGCRPTDWVCLRPRRGCDCWCRYLLCTRQACFGFLTPGEYVLTLAGEGCCLKLLVWLPPGANVALWWDPNIGEWGWRRERFHSFYNQA